jgi:hypothetical protein
VDHAIDAVAMAPCALEDRTLAVARIGGKIIMVTQRHPVGPVSPAVGMAHWRIHMEHPRDVRPAGRSNPGGKPAKQAAWALDRAEVHAGASPDRPGRGETRA